MGLFIFIRSKLAIMRSNLEDYYILQKLFLGNDLLIIFQYSLDIHERLVLELTEVVGFIDRSDNAEFKTLRIDEGPGGSYPFDLSLRLQRPEITNFPEAFVFTDKEETNFSFRACAKSIHLRQWTEKDIWLK
jgi:hypothetical protein